MNQFTIAPIDFLLRRIAIDIWLSYDAELRFWRGSMQRCIAQSWPVRECEAHRCRAGPGGPLINSEGRTEKDLANDKESDP